MLSHRNIGSNLEDGLPSWPTDESDVYLVPLPLNHIYGMLMINECNITGATLIIHKGFDPKLALRSITTHKGDAVCRCSHHVYYAVAAL